MKTKDKTLKQLIKKREIKVIKATCTLIVESSREHLEGVTHELEFYISKNQKAHGIIAEIIKK